MLGHTDRPLWAVHDLAMLDLDGVVYVGRDAVVGAPGHLAAARRAGQRLAFVTNNASRPPDAVAGHLSEIGVPASAGDVVTSAQAAARVLRDRLAPGSRVLCLGAAGLELALREAGLQPVGVEEEAEAAVTGYGPDVRWSEVMRTATRIRDGLWWVASNTDMTIPTPYGTAPGHGVLVETLRRFAGIDPQVAGKPARPLLDETVRRVGGRSPLMVGDRLDTDIAGGRVAEVETLLVLTGVTGLAELVAARPQERPTYLSRDLAGLGHQHPQPRREGDGWRVGGWWAGVVGGRVRAEPGDDGQRAEPSEDGQRDGSSDDWWRAVAVAAWAHADATGSTPGIDDLDPPR